MIGSTPAKFFIGIRFSAAQAVIEVGNNQAQ